MRSSQRMTVLSVALLSWGLGESPARAIEQNPNLGLYVSYSFGHGHGLGWGIYGSDLMPLRGEKQCSNLGQTPMIGAGPILRVGFRGLGHPRIVVAAAAGLDPAPDSIFMEGVVLEGGFTLPLGEGRLGPHGGLLVSGPVVHALVVADPSVGESMSLGLGAQFPGLLHYPDNCII